MAKRRRKANLANPNSMTWRTKADDMWSAVVKQVGMCEHCKATHKQLNSHHLIARGRLKYRHDVSNGVCLCVPCHSFGSDISPHIDSFSGENFLKWLKAERPGQFQWYEEHKEDKRQSEKTYEQCYYELLEIFEKGDK